MIYFKIGTIVTAAVGLLVYTLLFDRKYFFGLLTAEVICTGFLAFYTFYYIGSYNSSDNEVLLNANLNSEGGSEYLLNIDLEWREKPEIFGFNGDDDALIIRYNPGLLEMVSADKSYAKTQLGKAAKSLSKDFKYSNIGKNEQEIYFNVRDGENISMKVKFKEVKPGGRVKVYFLHDYKVPLESQVYWEKNELIELE